jgi:hypothetical protein
MTSAQFRALIAARGYTLRETARRWGLSPGRLSQLASAERRPAHYEEAAWGLPPKRLAEAVLHKRQRILERLAGQGSGADKTFLGDEYQVTNEQGAHLPEGVKGHVIAERRRAGRVFLTLQFNTGYEETFELAHLQSSQGFLVGTGRVIRGDGEPADVADFGEPTAP